MVLYKALYEYNSEETNDLDFQTNDVIEYMSQTSPSWYKGRNIMTGKIGLFPYNFVSKLDLSEDEDKLYVIIQSFDECLKGDMVVATEVQDHDVIGYLLKDKDQMSSRFPLNHVRRAIENPVAFTFCKCVAMRDSEEDSNQLQFSIGDTIWMLRKLDDTLAEGIINGHKGVFPLQSVTFDSEEEKTPSIDRKNRWIGLFDYKSENCNDLRFIRGEKLKFLDRIDCNWMLMQNEEGSVGMVPCNFVKNISIRDPPQPRTANEIPKDGRAGMPLQPIINELLNHQNIRISYTDIKFQTPKEALVEEANIQDVYDDTDENLCDQTLFRRGRKIDSETVTMEGRQQLQANDL